MTARMAPRKKPRFIRDERFEKLVDSIRDFPEAMPARGIVVDERGVILGGNMRYRACQELGMSEIPAAWVHRLMGLTVEQKRRFIIMDNRPYGEDDMDALANEWEISELLDAGFDEADLMGLTKDEPEDAEPQIDRAEELRKIWKVEHGQLWQLGGHKLLCGDCTKAEDVARVMGRDKPLLMVTDPPYGVEYDPEWREEVGLGKSETRRKLINDDRADWQPAWELFSGNVVYVWHASIYSPIVGDSLMAANFQLRNLIIWAKDRLVISRGNYHHQHEPCWYAVRKGCNAEFTEDRTQTTLFKNIPDIIRPGELIFLAKDKAKRVYGLRGDKSILWQIPKLNKLETGHSTQKPLECMARPVRNHKAAEVYDPFLGSGTTMIACENLNRKCFGIEISPAYCAVAIQRWVDVTGGKPERIE